MTALVTIAVTLMPKAVGGGGRGGGAGTSQSEPPASPELSQVRAESTVKL